uniref:Leucine rich repeats-containing protein n=1 Tax=Trepomonas sp. PC1 TaxID=1076344 RepID=A0A146KD42_9EUKA|eukprot:JAP93844.1 Leucine rich repeats-containing protein [Trepomonas sp. PC1]
MCNSLQQFVNSKLTSIDLSAFYDCKSMRLLDLPNVKKVVGLAKFQQNMQVRLPKCSNMAVQSYGQVFLSKDTPKSNQHKTLQQVQEQVLLYNAVMCTPVQIQTTLTVVQNQFAIRGLVVNTQTIPANQFLDSCLLFVEAKNLQTVQKQAFKNNYCLRRFCAPSLQSIDVEAFCGCVSLSEFEAKNVISVKAAAFQCCYSLIKLEFERLEKSDPKSFLNCNPLLRIKGNQKRYQEVLVDEFKERKDFKNAVEKFNKHIRFLLRILTKNKDIQAK